MNRSREHARLLMQRALDDAWILDRLADDPQAPRWGLGFHAQQAVEKTIKAVLTCRSIEYPYTHDLAVLADLLEASGLGCPPDQATWMRLTPFGTAFRYDEALGDDEVGRLPDVALMRRCVQQTLNGGQSIVGQTDRE